MDPRPRIIQQAASHFGVRVDDLLPLGGRSGQVFATEHHVLRATSAGLAEREAAASAAASVVVPVPEVLDRVDFGAQAVVLLERMPGTPAWVPERLQPERARRRGAACARVHALLATITPPSEIPVVDMGGIEGDSVLLHLDLHPLNILLDDDDEVSAVLDWANAASGPSCLDRARTATILYLDPSVQVLKADPSWNAFVAGWAHGAELDRIPVPALAWAARFMEEDLAGRVPAPELDSVRRLRRRALESGHVDFASL